MNQINRNNRHSQFSSMLPGINASEQNKHDPAQLKNFEPSYDGEVQKLVKFIKNCNELSQKKINFQVNTAVKIPPNTKLVPPKILSDLGIMSSINSSGAVRFGKLHSSINQGERKDIENALKDLKQKNSSGAVRFDKLLSNINQYESKDMEDALKDIKQKNSSIDDRLNKLLLSVRQNEEKNMEKALKNGLKDIDKQYSSIGDRLDKLLSRISQSERKDEENALKDKSGSGTLQDRFNELLLSVRQNEEKKDTEKALMNGLKDIDKQYSSIEDRLDKLLSSINQGERKDLDKNIDKSSLPRFSRFD